MDANTAVESRRFQDPHVLPFVVGVGDLKLRTLKASMPRLYLLLQFELQGQSEACTDF